MYMSEDGLVTLRFTVTWVPGTKHMSLGQVAFYPGSHFTNPFLFLHTRLWFMIETKTTLPEAREVGAAVTEY